MHYSNGEWRDNPFTPDTTLIAKRGQDRPAKVAGVGPDSPVAVNDRGGKQSHSPYRADLLPARAVLSVSEVLSQGAAKYGEDNWRKIAARDHVNHALVHLFAWLAGDGQDDHLQHAACRLLMALDLDVIESEDDATDELDRWFDDGGK